MPLISAQRAYEIEEEGRVYHRQLSGEGVRGEEERHRRIVHEDELRRKAPKNNLPAPTEAAELGKLKAQAAKELAEAGVDSHKIGLILVSYSRYLHSLLPGLDGAVVASRQALAALEAERQEKEAARQAEADAAWESRKQDALRRWRQDGGSESEFEASWPQMRIDMLREEVTQAESQGQAAQRRRIKSVF